MTNKLDKIRVYVCQYAGFCDGCLDIHLGVSAVFLHKGHAEEYTKRKNEDPLKPSTMKM